MRLSRLPLVDALGLEHVGERTLGVAHATEDNGAVDIGVREVRIEMDRKIKVGQRQRKVAAAIGARSPRSR